MPAETVSDNVETLINLALAEDFGSGDVTSTYFVPEHLTAKAILTPRKKAFFPASMSRRKFSARWIPP